MFCYVMFMLFSPVYLMFGLVYRGEQARLVLALHHQVLILQRQLGKRPSLVPIERLALVLSSLLLGKKRLTAALLIVRPETLVGWHRAIVRRHWRFLSRRKPGRRPEITPEMVQWVVRIARENPRMGYGKIAGEMRKLGFVRFGRSSVARILKRHGLTPERRRSVSGWRRASALRRTSQPPYERAGPALHLPKEPSDQFWHTTPVLSARRVSRTAALTRPREVPTFAVRPDQHPLPHRGAGAAPLSPVAPVPACLAAFASTRSPLAGHSHALLFQHAPGIAAAKLAQCHQRCPVLTPRRDHSLFPLRDRARAHPHKYSQLALTDS
jgi:hypothetical protein